MALNRIAVLNYTLLTHFLLTFELDRGFSVIMTTEKRALSNAGGMTMNSQKYDSVIHIIHQVHLEIFELNWQRQ